jgi:hypothetical protein
MPNIFADDMLDDAIRCIKESDLIKNEDKPDLIDRVLSLNSKQCLTVSSCACCRMVRPCEDRIGAILNGEET